MKLLQLLNFPDEKALANDLVAQLVKELPPKFLGDENNNKLSVNKITRSLERAYQEARNRQPVGRMGLLRRSIFANAFKWGLRESGYSNEFVDIATEGLVMELAKSR